MMTVLDRSVALSMTAIGTQWGAFRDGVEAWSEALLASLEGLEFAAVVNGNAGRREEVEGCIDAMDRMAGDIAVLANIVIGVDTGTRACVTSFPSAALLIARFHELTSVRHLRWTHTAPALHWITGSIAAQYWRAWDRGQEEQPSAMDREFLAAVTALRQRVDEGLLSGGVA